MTSSVASAAPRTVLALGDSLTAGYRLGPNDGFPAQLEAALKPEGRDVRVHNAGVSGDTSVGGKARLAWVLAGLVLIGAATHYAPVDRDFEVIDFFLLRGFRGRGAGRLVALDMFRRFPGRWELKVLPDNEPALAFWRKTIAVAGNGPFMEETADVNGEGEMAIFRFDIGSATRES